jgi:hypothetical protein
MMDGEPAGERSSGAAEHAQLTAVANESCLNLVAAEMSPELARVVDAWDNLPLHIRTSILALVDAAGVVREGGSR